MSSSGRNHTTSAGDYHDGSIGFYIMIALLGAGAAYGLSHKGQPRPAVTSGKKKLLIFPGVVFGLCMLLLMAVAMIAHNAPPQ